MARVTAAHATRSPRYLGKMMPRLAAPTCGRRVRCAACRWRPTAAPRSARPDRSRPCRCRARATRWRPGRAACPPSAGLRSPCAAARASEPWCARTSTSPARSLSAAARRSARRRLLTKISVERCACTSSSSVGWIALQIDCARRALRRRAARDVVASGRACAMSSTGTSMRRSSVFFCRGVDDGDRPIVAAAVRARRRTRA